MLAECNKYKQKENKSSFINDQYHNLWWWLVQTRRALYKVRAKELSQYDLIPEKESLMFVIQATGERATLAEISRWVLREPHTISHLVQTMEKEGLVKRVKDLDRKNLVRVTLTEKGKKAYLKTSKKGSVYRILLALSEEECQQMTKCLRKLRDKALEEIGAKPPKFPPFRLRRRDK